MKRKDIQTKKEKKNKEREIIKKIFFIISGCLLFYLSHPNAIFQNGLFFLAYFAYIPFFFLLKSVSLKNSWFYGAIYGSLSYTVFLFWLRNYSLIAIIFITFYFFVLYGLLFFLLKLLEKLFGKYSFLLQILAFSSFEYLRTLGFLGFSYGEIAYSQWRFLPLIQISNITGIFGLNLLLISFSFILAQFCTILNKSQFKDKKNLVKEPSFVSLIIWLFLFIAILFYGNSQLKLSQKKSSKFIKIALIQNNEHPWENGIEAHIKNVENLLSLSKSALKDGDIDIVVWPETAVVPSLLYHFYKMENTERFKLILKILSFMESSSANFLIGNSNREVGKDGEINYNSTLFFETEKNVFPPEPEIYSKRHLVPFSESFPLEKYFPKISERLRNGSPTFWTPGEDIKVFNYGDFQFVTPICFEDTFGADCRKMVLQGGRAFLNVSNDSWSESIACQKQHLSMAVFRNVENKVPGVRCTTSGQTCLITMNGLVEKELESFCSDYLIAELPIMNENFSYSFYTKHGDVFAIFILSLFLSLLLIRFLYVIIKKC